MKRCLDCGRGIWGTQQADTWGPPGPNDKTEFACECFRAFAPRGDVALLTTQEQLTALVRVLLDSGHLDSEAYYKKLKEVHHERL